MCSGSSATVRPGLGNKNHDTNVKSEVVDDDDDDDDYEDDDELSSETSSLVNGRSRSRSAASSLPSSRKTSPAPLRSRQTGLYDRLTDSAGRLFGSKRRKGSVRGDYNSLGGQEQ